MSNERSKEWLAGYAQGLAERPDVAEPGISDMFAAAIYFARIGEIPATVTVDRWEEALHKGRR